MIGKQLDEYPDYLISKDGLVHRMSSGFESRGHMCGDYLRLVFHWGTEKKREAVHRMVAIAYIPNPENKSMVNHLNGIKTDNRVENLEWATAKENVRHAWDMKLVDVSGENNVHSKLKTRHVHAIRALGEILPREEICELFNVKTTTVAYILNGKSWKHLGDL